MIRAAVADWNEGGFDAFAEHLAPDVVWHAPPGYPGEDVWHSRDAIRVAWGDQFGAVFSSMHTEILEIVQGPQRWLVRARTTMHGEGSGIDVESIGFTVFETENDLLTKVWLFLDEAPARETAGL